MTNEKLSLSEYLDRYQWVIEHAQEPDRRAYMSDYVGILEAIGGDLITSPPSAPKPKAKAKPSRSKAKPAPKKEKVSLLKEKLKETQELPEGTLSRRQQLINASFSVRDFMSLMMEESSKKLNSSFGNWLSANNNGVIRSISPEFKPLRYPESALEAVEEKYHVWTRAGGYHFLVEEGFVPLPDPFSLGEWVAWTSGSLHSMEVSEALWEFFPKVSDLPFKKGQMLPRKLALLKTLDRVFGTWLKEGNTSFVFDPTYNRPFKRSKG